MNNILWKNNVHALIHFNVQVFVFFRPQIRRFFKKLIRVELYL